MVRAMRLLHTSDWHLGRSLHKADLREAQERFLDHLVETAREERVDAVLIAGDVYDRAVPPVDAVALCEQALVRLRDTGARVVVISGNHDSARRLGFSSALIDASGVHLRTRPATLAEPVMLLDDHGPVAVYGVPYLEPAVGLPGFDGPRAHSAVLAEAAARIRADAAARGVRRTVVVAHAWVAGGGASDSERDISVGGVGYVPASLFDGFSYVALGHLHGQQTIAEHMRYSGSPLPYSFSEAHHKKGSWLVEVGADGATRAERVPAPVSPCSRNRPSRSSKPTSSVAANAPKAWTRSRCGRTQHAPSRTDSNAAVSSSCSASLAGAFRTCLTNSAAIARSSRPLTRSP